MAKRQKRVPFVKTICLIMNIHSDNPPEMIRVVFKDENLESAIEFSRKMWATANDPYIVTIVNEDGKQLFIHKKK